MEEYCSEDSYTPKYMKKRVIEHLGDDVIITEITGKPNVVTFRSNAASILHKFFERPKQQDDNVEKLRIIETAANLIKNEIKLVETSKINYPLADDISSIEQNLDFIPITLRLFLRKLFLAKNSDLRIASIGQAIVQATRPRVFIAPLQIGLGVQMHRHFGSKFLIYSLNSHGFCSSYSEVKKFEVKSADAQQKEIPGYIPGQFAQFIADNVDHNVRTLDGANTFHGMGIIAVRRPGVICNKLIPRIKKTAEELALQSRIKIHYY